MGFSIETSVSAVTVFLQGALSFFSPCVLPLVPLGAEDEERLLMEG